MMKGRAELPPSLVLSSRMPVSSSPDMSQPDVLPIKRMDDLHTNLIGCSSAGQFMIIECSDGRAPNKIFVVRYLFNTSGEFKHVKLSRLGRNASLDEITREKTAYLDELEPYRLCEFRVQPFEVSLDGIAFGLLYSEETQSVSLEPGSLITFMAPWDGEYFT